MPSWSERAWSALPKPIQDAVASGIDKVRGVQLPPAPAVDTSLPYRLLIGPVNYAGQGSRWARAAEETGLVDAVNLVGSENNPFGYHADISPTWRTMEHSRAWQHELLETVKRDFTHVLVEACFPAFGGLYGGDLRRQIDELQRAGVHVGMVGHGTDVRLPSRHTRSEAWSYFVDAADWAPVDQLELQVQQNLNVIAELGLPTFVSTPGLLIDLPTAHFLGVIVDPDRWANDSPALHRARPKVVHAPTNAHIKGTTLITPTLHKLHDEGVIEYAALEGIPNDQMPRVYADADIVLDQFRVGDYGVAACESMAAGRLVLGHVSDQARTEVARHANMPLPLLETTIDSIEEVLRAVAANPMPYREHASAGPEFVRRLHDGRFSAAVLMRDFFDATA